DSPALQRRGVWIVAEQRAQSHGAPVREARLSHGRDPTSPQSRASFHISPPASAAASVAGTNQIGVQKAAARVAARSKPSISPAELAINPAMVAPKARPNC